jgi:flagellar biosynthetic protein FliR
VDAVRFLALFARVAGLLTALPLLNAGPVPVRFRLLLALAITLTLAPVLPPEWQIPVRAEPVGLVLLTVIMVQEVLMGLIAGLCVRLVQEAFAFGGAAIGRDMGFGFAQQVDPALEETTPLIGTLLNFVFLMVFILADGHLALIRLVGDSLAVPPGAFSLGPDIGNAVSKGVTDLFAVGLRLSLPILAAMLFVNIGLALMAKFGEEFEVLMLAFPIRIGLGLLLLAASAPVFIPLGRDLLNQVLSGLPQLLGFA